MRKRNAFDRRRVWMGHVKLITWGPDGPLIFLDVPGCKTDVLVHPNHQMFARLGDGGSVKFALPRRPLRQAKEGNPVAVNNVREAKNGKVRGGWWGILLPAPAPAHEGNRLVAAGIS